MTVTLVTGGCGFLGAAIARGFQARGDRVIVLDVAEECPIEGVEYRRVDITDEAAVIEACKGADAIVRSLKKAEIAARTKQSVSQSYGRT